MMDLSDVSLKFRTTTLFASTLLFVAPVLHLEDEVSITQIASYVVLLDMLFGMFL